MPARTYIEDFYRGRRPGVLRSAEPVVDWLLSVYPARSVLDVGCAAGGWLSMFLNKGVPRLLGLDGSWIPRDLLLIPESSFQEVDLRLPWRVPEKFDLALCLETAEHLPPPEGRSLVERLTEAAPVVLFSAAVPHQGGLGHLNEQWPQYWIDAFKQAGHVCVDCARRRFWNDERVNWWYSQNMLVFVSRTATDLLERFRAQERGNSFGGLPVVHPRLLDSAHRAPAKPSLRRAMGALAWRVRRLLGRAPGPPSP